MDFEYTICVLNRFCGYGNAVSFKDIDESDIASIENFVKSELQLTLKEELESTNTEYDHRQKSCFFGRFSSKPETFRFDKGELKQIMSSVKFVKRKVDEPEENANITYFNDAELEKNNKSYRKKLFKSVLGYVYGNIQNKGSDTVMTTIDSDKLKNTLFEKATSTFSKYPHLSAKREWNKTMVQVNKTDESIKGKIVCIYCEQNDTPGEVAVHCRSIHDTTWVTSNLITHINRRHDNQKKMDVALPTMAASVMSSIGNATSSKSSVDNSVNRSPAATSETTINLEIEPAIENEILECESTSFLFDNTMEVNFKEMMVDQVSVQMIKMDNLISQHGEQRRAVSFGKGSVIGNRKIEICEAKKDGNCLFTSLCHQIYHAPIGSDRHEKYKFDLRKDVVEHIETNFAGYIHQLKDRVFDRNPKIEKTAIDAECRKFLKEKLSQPTIWGGAETITAVSEIHQVNIVVINDDETCNMPCAFNSQYTKCALIFFSNTSGGIRNHYDSVISISNQLKARLLEILSVAENKRAELNNISKIDID